MVLIVLQGEALDLGSCIQVEEEITMRSLSSINSYHYHYYTGNQSNFASNRTQLPLLQHHWIGHHPLGNYDYGKDNDSSNDIDYIQISTQSYAITPPLNLPWESEHLIETSAYPSSSKQELECDGTCWAFYRTGERCRASRTPAYE
jgi:hypothetical protein